ncbi:hypothetical protein LEM8419_01567 [Neolewinella maritima]|uniref:NlpC/P60 domain-containing protein n=1 Tax=Neolewinella maritima TaxID=1383882 RepID=A0ABM9B194_9BACT|nr:NlpC/P60 family protein [Neolewinella maritima]CAH1000414.1 hypothetical protein LEM8419_01567 [Neolewinella maritima]
MPPSSLAIGKYTAAAIRSQPRDDAPLRSQLLLGEPVRLLMQQDHHATVQRAEDGLEGYVRLDQLQTVPEQIWQQQCDAPAFALELFQAMLCSSYGLPVTFGARLPEYDGLQSLHLQQRFVYSGQVLRAEAVDASGDLLIRLARRWLYAPQLVGGRTPTGIDGPGLIQLLYRMLGIVLPYTVGGMLSGGRSVDFVEQCQEGDLAFFDTGQGKVCHLGLILPHSQVLHVHGYVRLDGLDHFGIFDYGCRQYTHRLRLVKRWLPDRQASEIALTEDRSAVLPDARQMAIF